MTNQPGLPPPSRWAAFSPTRLALQSPGSDTPWDTPWRLFLQLAAWTALTWLARRTLASPDGAEPRLVSLLAPLLWVAGTLVLTLVWLARAGWFWILRRLLHARLLGPIAARASARSLRLILALAFPIDLALSLSRWPWARLTGRPTCRLREADLPRLGLAGLSVDERADLRRIAVGRSFLYWGELRAQLGEVLGPERLRTRAGVIRRASTLWWRPATMLLERALCAYLIAAGGSTCLALAPLAVTSRRELRRAAALPWQVFAPAVAELRARGDGAAALERVTFAQFSRTVRSAAGAERWCRWLGLDALLWGSVLADGRGAALNVAWDRRAARAGAPESDEDPFPHRLDLRPGGFELAPGDSLALRAALSMAVLRALQERRQSFSRNPEVWSDYLDLAESDRRLEQVLLHDLTHELLGELERRGDAAPSPAASIEAALARLAGRWVGRQLDGIHNPPPAPGELRALGRLAERCTRRLPRDPVAWERLAALECLGGRGQEARGALARAGELERWFGDRERLWPRAWLELEALVPGLRRMKPARVRHLAELRAGQPVAPFDPSRPSVQDLVAVRYAIRAARVLEAQPELVAEVAELGERFRRCRQPHPDSAAALALDLLGELEADRAAFALYPAAGRRDATAVAESAEDAVDAGVDEPSARTSEIL